MKNEANTADHACEGVDCNYRDERGSYGVYKTCDGPKRLCGDCTTRQPDDDPEDDDGDFEYECPEDFGYFGEMGCYED